MKKTTVVVLVLLLMFATVLAAGMLKAGDMAPDFSLTDHKGRTVTLSGFLGKKNVILYFYPKDFSVGCTAQACSFRDNYGVIAKKGAVVIGVSFDSDESHVKFAKENKLPFSLISDPNGELGAKYGVPRLVGTKFDRVTFVIDKKGVIRYVFKSVKDATMHVDNALKELDKLQVRTNSKK